MTRGPRSALAMPSRPRLSRRSNVERTASARRVIIGAAIDILASKGFSALSNSAILSRTSISSGALMHHFPSRSDLLVAVVENAYATLQEFRRRQLEGLEIGLPRFRAIIDLAWLTSQTPQGIAVNEVRIGARSDGSLARSVSPILTHIANDYGRFVGRLVREAGLKSVPEMQGLWAATAMAVRSLAIDRSTYQNQQNAVNALFALRMLREELIARELGRKLCIDPSLPNIAISEPSASATSRRPAKTKR